ncbi:MAG: SigE family RNA polymerase sigma factor [Nocardioidaceae bacterium]
MYPRANADADFTEYVAARSGALMGLALHLCGGRQQLAEDLLQTTLLRTYVSWGRVKDPQSRDAYVRKIMVRASYRLRSAGTEPVALADAHLPAAPDHGQDVAVRLDVWQAIQALSPRQRAVLVLRYYADLSEEEIAVTMGCSTGSVKRHASRGLAKLRIQLDPTTALNERTS